MAYELSSVQRQLLLQALDCIRNDLRPSLSPRQALFANRAAECISQALGNPVPDDDKAAAATHSGAAGKAGECDPLDAALGRLDACLTRRLREGRLSPESRRALHAELRSAAQILARPPAANGPAQTVHS